MIVYVYAADTTGCGHYRMIRPAEALRAQGHDVRIVLPNQREDPQNQINITFDPASGRIVQSHFPPDADVIVLQRVSRGQLSTAIPAMRAKGIAVVVDMDDDLTKIDPANPAFWAMRSDHGNPHHNARNAMQACLAATLVTVSTPALLPIYAPHGRGMVLENRIPAAYLNIPHDVSNTRVGWAGSTHSHPLDLHELGPAIQRLAREGIGYYGVGPADGLKAALGLVEDPPVSGSVDIGDWGTAVAQLGIGLVPLADTLFNTAKSHLKGLELSACGVPWVASPRAEYVKLQKRLGVGLLAKDPKDWYRHIKRLATNNQLRVEQSEAGRAAAKDWTIEGNAHLWMEAWTKAFATQRGSTRRPLIAV